MESTSAVSWPAIIAGAFVASAVTLILLALGSGIGLAGVAGITLAVASAIWLIVTQWISAGLGGYIAGRLRSRWVGTHTHEVFFRDTAHGLITWAVASVLIALTFGSAAFKSNAMAMGHGAGTSYEIDRLLRTPSAGAAATAADPKAEIAHILAEDAGRGKISAADREYLAQLVMSRSGVTAGAAQLRVDEFLSAVAAARKAAAEAAILLALSLLVGAFIASVAAALGGRLRDEHP